MKSNDRISGSYYSVTGEDTIKAYFYEDSLNIEGENWQVEYLERNDTDRKLDRMIIGRENKYRAIYFRNNLEYSIELSFSQKIVNDLAETISLTSNEWMSFKYFIPIRDFVARLFDSKNYIYTDYLFYLSSPSYEKIEKKSDVNLSISKIEQISMTDFIFQS